MNMIPGAVIGNVIGSSIEVQNLKSKDFPLVSETSRFSSDSLMTMAIAHALMKWPKGSEIDGSEFEHAVIDSMQEFAKKYPKLGYGGAFKRWLHDRNPQPYGSWGNGSAMRVSPVAWYFDDLQTVERFAELSARVTHNHPEGIKGAQATATAIFLARTGKSKDDIRSYISIRYGYDLNRTCDEIRPDYELDESCQGTVPEAIIAFLDGKDFEDAVRNAVSLGGDSDTIACITGAIAEGMWEVPDDIEDMVRPVLDEFMLSEIEKWNEAVAAEDKPEENTERVKNGITEMVFILDRSGSMHGLEDDTIGNFNSLIDKQKAEPGEAYVSTVLFSDKSSVIHDRLKLADVPAMTHREYRTMGCTALLDAIGDAIKHISGVHKNLPAENVPENTMFVIITDGMENASEKYSGSRIKKLVEEKKAKQGWEFLFIGANIDAIAAAGNIGISRDRAVNYRSDSRGTDAVFTSVGRAMFSMRSAKRVEEDWSAEIEQDFVGRSSFDQPAYFRRHKHKTEDDTQASE